MLILSRKWYGEKKWSPGPPNFVNYIKTIFFNYSIALFAEIIHLQCQLLFDYHFFDSNLTLKENNTFFRLLKKYYVISYCVSANPKVFKRTF